MIGFKHRATFSSNQKKLTVTSLHTFSRTSRHLHVLSLSFHWLIEFSMFSSILLSEMQFKTLILLNIDKPQSITTEKIYTPGLVSAKAGPRARLDSSFVGFTGGLVTILRASNGRPAVSLLFIHIHTQTAMTRMLARNSCGSAVGMDSY